MTVTVRDVYDLTPLQQGMLFHALLEPESQLYVEQITVPFAGAVAWPAFRRAWQDVADHHDALRTSFHWSGIATPVQVVHADASMSVDAIDLLDASGRPGPRRLADVQASDRARGFDLERPPLFRVALVRSGPGDVALVLSFHHMILDGWSLQLVLRDFGTAYRQRARGEVPRLPPAGRYRDYLLWIQSQDLDAAERHWRETLRGAGGPTPLWSDGTTSGGAFADHEAVVSVAATEAAERAAAQSRVTLNTVAQAAWALALGLSTASDDVTFGITVSGRPGELDNVEQMVGLFINTIPLRLRIDPDASVAGWLRDVQRRMVEARQFEYSPLVDVHRWGGLPAGTPLFDSIVAFENYPIAVARNGDEAAPATFAERTNYPLSAVIVPGERLRLRVLFDERHLHRSAVERLAERYEMMLVALGGASHRLLRELPTLTSTDAAVIDGWHSPPRRLAPRTVHENFERSAAAHAHHIALEFGDRTWTYRELDAAAEALTQRLVDAGVDVDDRVGVFAERSPEFVIALLATLRAGAVYVPLDPSNPASRLRAILDDTGASLILAPAEHDPVIDDLGASVMSVPAKGHASPRPRRAPPVRRGPNEAAYVMYTSGSTGEPKGAVVPHQAINRLVLGADYLQIGPDDRIVHLSNCSFDAATFEIWGALLNGARLVAVDEDTALRPDRFARFLAERSITVAFVTTALLNRIAAERPAAFATVDVVLFGGEAVDPKWVRRIRDAGARRLLHVYGPTETTTFATWHEVDRVADDAVTVPIGRAIANTSVHVLDRCMRPTPIGAVGELYVGGIGVAHGYLGRPGVTAERFVPDPTGTGDRLYRTGDRVRATPAGIEFVGRVDEQIKLRGFRIEPGEIERVVMSHPRVAACAVVVRAAHDGDNELVAYVAPDQADDHPDPAPDLAHDLAALLRRELPLYMRPSSITVLASLPLNSNGKIDRRALPDPARAVVDEQRAGAEPATPTQCHIAAVWCEVLGATSVGIHDDFFELGGHSLRATQVLSRIHRDLHADVALREVFDHPTIESLAALIDSRAGTTPSLDRIATVRRDGRRRNSEVEGNGAE